MRKREYYINKLKRIEDWIPYLLKESGLPGKRGNLELMQAVVALGSEELFIGFLKYDPKSAPTNSPYEFLAFCGVVGLGRLIAEGKKHYFGILRNFASDPRWRIREGVAIALQIIGERDPENLAVEIENWKDGNLFERRAVIAGLCEPKLLKEKKSAIQALQTLNHITSYIENESNRKNEGFRVLRKGLAYCWSVAVVAFPEEGKKMMERWIQSKDKDIQWIMRENLKKNRLIRMDSNWVERMQTKIQL